MKNTAILNVVGSLMAGASAVKQHVARINNMQNITPLPRNRAERRAAKKRHRF